MWKKFTLIILLTVLLGACAQSDVATETSVLLTPTPFPTPEAGTVVVDPEASWGPISPYILGSNYGPWVAVSVDMLPSAYESGVRAIRFPGGAWGDRNDLKPYHIDPFIAFCEQMGAIPTISVRLREGTPEQAAALVRYVNIEKEYGVVYWAIGNEPTLFAAELQTLGKADDYDTVQYNQEWRAFAEAMKAVDPTIKLMGPEIHQFNANYEFNPKDSAGRDWMTEFLKANGDLVDVVTFHRYPFPRSREAPDVTVADLREQSQEWSQTIVYLRGLIEEITGRDIPIAITEVNTHYNQAVGGEGTPDSHYNAIWLAELFGQMMVQDVFMVNHWMLTSKGGQGGWGIIGAAEERPSYDTFQLFKQMGSEMIAAASGINDLSIYAAKREDGTLTLILVNLADTPQTATLQVQGVPLGQAKLWQLDPEHRPDAGTPFTFADDGNITLPGQSVSLLIIQP